MQRVFENDTLCYIKEKWLAKIIDLTDCKFGTFTVKEFIGKNKYNRAVWLCECDCGNQKEIVGAVLRQGKGIYCSNCDTRGLKLTHKDFVNKIYQEVKDEYTILGQYINADTPIKIKHNICGYIWNVTPSNFTSRKNPTRCPICSRKNSGIKRRKTKEEFINDIYDKNKYKFQIIGEYKTSDDSLLIKCNNCKTEFEINRAARLKSQNVLCPKCMKPKYKECNTTEWFKQRMYKLVKDEYELMGDFYGAEHYISLKHNVCGNIYDTTIASSFLAVTRCPYCNFSKGEKKIQVWLENNNISYIPQKTFPQLKNSKYGRGLSYDYFLDRLNILIEYQGEQHDHPVKYSKNMSDDTAYKRYIKQTNNDELKRKFAKEQGYELLEIWYKDFENIESILNNFIKKGDKKCLKRRNKLSTEESSSFTEDQVQERVVQD